MHILIVCEAHLHVRHAKTTVSKGMPQKILKFGPSMIEFQSILALQKAKYQ